MLSISSGHSADYLTSAVATGRENYYSGAVAAGEPPGRWYGAGAATLGLSGLVDEQDMTALYERFLDPRDPHFRDPEQWGQTATLGHTGRRYLTEEEIYAQALEREPGADPERRAQLRLEAGKRARKNVAFHDATFSVQKSITVLHTAFEAQEVEARRTAEQAAHDEHAARTAGDQETAKRYAYRYTQARTAQASWAAHRRAVEDAIWAGNQAGLDYLADKAGYSRIGHHGGAAGRYIDAHDWTIASFFQHDSRNHDPQLHIHNAILNRVQGTDGIWRTLDSRALHKYRGAAAAVAERTTEEHLADALGVRFATRPDGKAREILGVPAEVMELFSSRRRAITAKTAQLVAVFQDQFGRPPNGLELDRLQRQATLATRHAKTHDGETVEERLSRWDAQLRAEVAGGLHRVAADVLTLAGTPPSAEDWSPAAILETALADVQAKKAAWSPADLTRAISDALPDRLGTLDGRQVTRLLNGLTAAGLTLAVPLDAERPGQQQLPQALRLANGRSAYDAPGGRLYATPDHIHTERLLATHSSAATAYTSREKANRLITSLAEDGIELGADQAAAVRGILTSGADVESLVGPAGTGKSFVLGALAKAWTDPAVWEGAQRRVIGLATSQIATEVLAAEGLTALNVTRWLHTQERLTGGSTHPDHEQWRINAGDLIVLDEASMTTTTDLARIHQTVTAAGGKLLLTGDHKQLAAVGAAGGMELALTAGPSYELTDVRRFEQTWERDASLRLRERDETAVQDYHRSGRLIDGGPVEQAEASAIRAYLADSLTGRQSLLIVDSNEHAARVSAQIRSQLIHLGRVADTGVHLGRDGTTAGVGDLIQARRNAWELSSIDGVAQQPPINRRHYEVLACTDDGGLTVAPVLGASPSGRILGDTVRLPADYVAQHVTLGYACTVHAAEGLSVDTSHAVISPRTGPDALYVGLTRGRTANTAHVVTQTPPTSEAPTGETHEALHRSPASVLAAILDNDNDRDSSALAAALTSTRDAESVRTPAELFADAAELATTGRTARWLDELTAAGTLTTDQRVTLAAEDADTTLARTLRRAELAGHNPHTVLHDAVTARPLTDARQLTNVINSRITSSLTLDPTGDSHADWIPAGIDADWHTYLTSLADAADTRARELATDLAADPPQWAVESLGPVPDDPAQRQHWERNAAAVAAHRELAGHQGAADPIGPPPKPGQPEAYASWRAAWRALGRPEADRAETEMSDGQLRLRIRAYEREQAWAPRYVADELAGTIQTAEQHRNTATLRRAEAEAAADDNGRAAGLREEAHQADALARTLNEQVEQLRQIDEARARWLTHTAGTRAAADRAKAELTARRATDAHDEPTVTAEEWLTEHQVEALAADEHRPITAEHELTDIASEREADQAAVQPLPEVDTVETALPDIRDTAQSEANPETDVDQVRVPTADQTAEAVARAQRALTEMDYRDAVDQQNTQDHERAQQLARWTAEVPNVQDHAEAERANGAVLERASTFD